MLYGNNDWRDYLAHHGIQGQRWGVRNGPPYPLGGTSDPRHTGKDDSERKRTFVSNLSKELDTQWDYGVLMKNGKRFTDEDDGLSNFNWEKDYRTMPLDKLKKEKIGVCWDFVNYQHDELKKAGIKDSSYMILMDLSDENRKRTVTHTFTTFELDGKTYWLESAMWPKRGVHEIKNYKQAAKEIQRQYTKEKKPYSLFKYNPEGLDQNLTDQEFYDRVTEGNWIGDFNTNTKKG